jgi:serine/threonine protein kinase
MDSENNIKLGDFGLSRVLTDSNNFAISNVGTPYYMSPEQIEELEYNEKSDIWSLGCFLYEISSLTPPFEASNHLSLANKIKLGKFDRIPTRYSEELFRIINWMLNVEPSKRPTLADLINIPNVSLRLRERRLKDNIAKYKYLEEMHKLKENELQSKEKNLKEFENLLKERELKLEAKEKYLIEKERNMDSKASKSNIQSKENIEKIFEKSESNPCKLHDLLKSENLIKRINTSGVLTTENSENSSNQKEYFFTPVIDKFTNKNPLQTPKEKNMKFLVKCDILENKEKSRSEKIFIEEAGDKFGDNEGSNQV